VTTLTDEQARRQVVVLAAEAATRYLEWVAKFNPNHDPHSGRFSSGAGAGDHGSVGQAREFGAGDDWSSEATVKSAMDWERASYGSWCDSLTQQEKAAINSYQHNPWINHVARNDNVSASGTARKLMARLDSAIDRARTPEDVIAYRGIANIHDLGLTAATLPEHVGHKLRDRGFMSMSLSRDIADSFGTPNLFRFSRSDRGAEARALLRIRISKNSAVASASALAARQNQWWLRSQTWIHPLVQVHELIAARGHALKLTAVQPRNGGGFLIDADLIAPGATS
jgi:hypothetical protein